MLYELKAILKELDRTNKKIKKNAYQEGEIQEKKDQISDFSELLDNIQKCASSLQEMDQHDINTIIKTLSKIDANLGICTNHIEEVQEAIRQFLLQFSDEETKEILT